MYYNNFESLEINKKESILIGCIEEFAEHGYESASTNMMVKKIKMSKGSLFKYFNTKEELYIYIIEYIFNNVFSSMAERVSQLPKDIFERLYKIAEIELDFYLEKPMFYKLYKQAFSGENEISRKLIQKYEIQSETQFALLFIDAEFSNMRFDKKYIINFSKWILKGYNEDFMNNIIDIKKTEGLKEEYLKG